MAKRSNVSRERGPKPSCGRSSTRSWPTSAMPGSHAEPGLLAADCAGLPGLCRRTNTMHRNVVIIGSGPAGLTAALYAARANLEPLVIRGLQPGGLIATTSEVENYPGFVEAVGGFDLADNMEKQAARFGAQYMDALVEQVDFSERPFKLTIDSGEIVTADTVIVSTGA